MPRIENRSPEDVVRAMFAAADNWDTAGQLSFLTDDVVWVFGNMDASGKEALGEMARQARSVLLGFRHEIHDIWRAGDEGHVLIAEMTVHYSKLDGEVISLPCCNIFRMRGDLICDYRVYMDATPVFA
jgi:ketosteroid isomerase-like protein